MPFFGKFPNLPDYTQLYPNLPESSRKFPKVPDYARSGRGIVKRLAG